MEKVCNTVQNLPKVLDQIAKELLLELKQDDSQLRFNMLKTEQHNRWFTQKTIEQAVSAICHNFLQKENLTDFLKSYQMKSNENVRNVGLILAGNIPMVGFHDVLCCLLSGHRALIKSSSKDKFLIPYFLEKLVAVDEAYRESYEFVERLSGFDAVIATGSSNSGRYFHQYFGKYPNIIRENRTSVAILTGKESKEELQALGHDVFDYYGLGCRSVSKLYLPKDYLIPHLLDQWANWKPMMDHNKYKNNYDYHRAILLLNQSPHLASEYVMLEEKEPIFTPVSVLHYEFYEEVDKVLAKLQSQEKDIQCIVSNWKGESWKTVPFGQSQQPKLNDFADNVDTMEFLLNLP